MGDVSQIAGPQIIPHFYAKATPPAPLSIHTRHPALPRCRRTKAPPTGPDQGLCKRKNWAALVVLTETLKTAPLTVTTLVIGGQRLEASRLRALSTMKPV